MVTNTQVTVGQEVGVRTYTSWDSKVSLGWTVQKITPAGQIVVRKMAVGGEQVKRFNRNLDEVGVTRDRFYSAPRLELDIEACRREAADRQLKEKAVVALHAISGKIDPNVNTKWSKETLTTYVTDLEALLVAAKAAIEKM